MPRKSLIPKPSDLKDRYTVRLNEDEKHDLILFMRRWGIKDPAAALKAGFAVSNQLKNVTDLLCPPNYRLVLSKDLKTDPLGREVFD